MARKKIIRRVVRATRKQIREGEQLLKDAETVFRAFRVRQRRLIPSGLDPRIKGLTPSQRKRFRKLQQKFKVRAFV